MEFGFDAIMGNRATSLIVPIWVVGVVCSAVLAAEAMRYNGLGYDKSDAGLFPRPADALLNCLYEQTG